MLLNHLLLHLVSDSCFKQIVVSGHTEKSRNGIGLATQLILSFYLYLIRLIYE